ncbi:MAG: hypothetical protein P4L77_11645 [Sulfuriferula sp.]|nr:hypothetical protein [Sulfuriferula sp.]
MRSKESIDAYTTALDAALNSWMTPEMFHPSLFKEHDVERMRQIVRQHYVDRFTKSMDDAPHLEIESGKIKESLASMMAFADVMADIKNAARRSIKIELDEDDPNPLATIVSVLKEREAEFPDGLHTAASITEWLNRSGINYTIEGHPGIPKMSAYYSIGMTIPEALGKEARRQLDEEMRFIDSTAETEKYPLLYNPATGKPYMTDAEQPTAHAFRIQEGPIAWMYNPWTRAKRDPRDIGTDVLGYLIVPPQYRRGETPYFQHFDESPYGPFPTQEEVDAFIQKERAEPTPGVGAERLRTSEELAAIRKRDHMFWSYRYYGSETDKGYTITSSTGLNRDKVIYLGDKLTGEEIQKIVNAHNEVVGLYYPEVKIEGPGSPNGFERYVSPTPEQITRILGATYDTEHDVYIVRESFIAELAASIAGFMKLLKDRTEGKKEE